MKKSNKAIPNSVLNLFAVILAAGLAFASFGCKVNVDESYAITVSGTEHGSVESSASSATAGSTVTLTVSPESGYKLDTLTLTDASGSEVKTTEVKAGEKYTFKMPKSEVSVFATFSVPLYNIRVSDMENGYVIPNVYFAEEGSTITLSVTTYDSSLGTLTVTDTSGKNVTITAVTEGSEYTFTMPASDVTVQATFIANMYNITVSDTEHGSVKASASSATAGSTITLTVMPESGYKLDTLTVTDESGLQLPISFPDVLIEGLEADFTFTMYSSDVTVQATFSVIISDITVLDSGSGGSVKANVSRATAGSTVTLTVTPENGYRLVTLNVRDASGNEVTTTEVKAGSEYTFTMPSSAVSVLSTFTEIIYDITVSGTEYGYVTPSTNWAAEGSEITLSASPYSGYRLDTLTVKDGNGKNVATKIVTKGEKYTFTMPASDVTVQAIYVAAIYNITVSSAEHGSVTASASSAAYGSTVTITVTPENGYKLGTLTVTDTLRNVWYPTAVTEGSVYTFTMPASDVTVQATFSDIYYNITSSSTDYGYVIASASSAAEGREIMLTVSPYPGYRLDTLTVTDTTSGKKVIAKTVTEGEKYTFKMPASDVTVSATYVAAIYSITIPGTEHGSVKVASSAAYGSTVTLTVTPESGYKLNYLTVKYENEFWVSTTEVKAGEVYTFTMPASDVTVQADFSDIDYNITVSDAEHGYVSASASSAAEGNEITLTLTPESVYKLDTLSVTDASGKNIATKAVREGEVYTFTMPASDVTVQAIFSVIIPKYNITISSAEHGSVKASASSAAEGDEITLTVTPESGFSFGSLSVRIIVTDEISLSVETKAVREGEVYTFTMPASNVTVQATFSVIIHDDIYYNITVSDAENGYVNSSNYTATEGENITLTVSPYSDYRLDTLTVTDASGKNVSTTAVTEGEKYIFTMPASDVTVKATFSDIYYSITVSDTEHGNVTASKSSATNLSEITLTVTPEIGYRLGTLTVTDAGGNDSYPTAVTEGEKYTFTIFSSDVTVSATFEPILYKITTSSSANGRVYASTASAAYGSTVTVTVTPMSGYRLDSLDVTDASGKNIATKAVKEGSEYTFTMPLSDVTVQETFVASIYNITVSDSEHGSVTSSASSAAYLSKVTLTVTPESGYILDELTVTDASGRVQYSATAEDVEYTFTMPDSDVTVLATFTVITYNISAFNGVFGKVKASPSSAKAGSTVTLTVTPESGYILDELTVTDASGNTVTTNKVTTTGVFSSSSKYTFTMPSSDVKVSASFEAIKYSINISDTEHGSVSAVSNAVVGSTITLTATSESGYILDELTVKYEAGKKIETTLVSANANVGKYEYTFTMPASNVNVSATFKNY